MGGFKGGVDGLGTKGPACHQLLSMLMAGRRPPLRWRTACVLLGSETKDASGARPGSLCWARRSQVTRSGERGSGGRGLGVPVALAASWGRAGPVDRVPFQDGPRLSPVWSPLQCGPAPLHTLGLDSPCHGSTHRPVSTASFQAMTNNNNNNNNNNNSNNSREADGVPCVPADSRLPTEWFRHINSLNLRHTYEAGGSLSQSPACGRG